jgi:T-complex protein 1 subunit zeta
LLTESDPFQVLEEVKVKVDMDRETLINVARTSLGTKVNAKLADMLTEAVVDSVMLVRKYA